MGFAIEGICLESNNIFPTLAYFLTVNVQLSEIYAGFKFN